MSSDFEQLASDLQNAIVAGDLAAADRVYADDVIVWHNYDGLDCDKATSLKAITSIHEEYAEFGVSDVHRDFLADGYVQRTVFHGVDRAGTARAINTMMRVWVRDGQIYRIEEYSDTAGVTPTEITGATTHDAPLPARLVANMLQGWDDGDDPALRERQDVSQYTAGRRAALSARFPGDLLVIPTGGLKYRANDVPYPFRAGSDFAWLVGDLEPDRVLVMIPEVGGHRSVIFTRPRADRTTTGFFADRSYGELWIGPSRGPEEVSQAFAIETAPLADLAGVLKQAGPVRALLGVDPRVDELVRSSTGRSQEDASLAAALAGFRLCKDDFEIKQLQRAVDATITGFADVVGEFAAAGRSGRGERWLEGTFWRRARQAGNEVGYGSVVACGPHATITHWENKTGAVQTGDLALLDMGIESDHLYTADVTRVFPISGEFSAAQRRVYDTVLRAQQAAIDAIRPGAAFLDPHRAAMRVITEELLDWGLLSGSADSLLVDQMHRRWTLHGTSHHLGLDVHDCAAARAEDYRGGVLKPGMVITAEPGLYFQPNDTLAPVELRGLGVRIEDDVLVTETGNRVLSAALPTGVDELRHWQEGHAR